MFIDNHTIHRQSRYLDNKIQSNFEIPSFSLSLFDLIIKVKQHYEQITSRLIPL